MLTPNPTNDRLKFILKTYGQKKPAIVMDMVDIIARTVGVDDWAARLDMPESREADPLYFEDLEKWYNHARGGAYNERTTTALATATVALVNELPQFQMRHRADPIFPWIATQLAKLDPSSQRHPEAMSVARSTYRELFNRTRRGGTMLAQWYEANRPNLGDYGLDEALREAQEWSDTEGPVPQGEVVTKLADGWTAQRLTTKEQLDAEGNKMQHCVGGYSDAVAKGRTTIYSLRDPKGQPHVTIEVQNKRVQQMQGKQNAKPAEKYQKYVDEFFTWLEEHNIETARVPKHLQAYADAIEQHGHDVEEEYLADYAAQWNEHTRNAEEAAEWMKSGVSYNEAELAGALAYEKVTPAEYAKFPYAVHVKITSQGGVPRDLDKLVAIARMTNKLIELLPQRDPPLPPSKQAELFEREPTVPKRMPGQDPQGVVPIRSRWEKDPSRTHLGYRSIAFHEWEDIRRGDDVDAEWLYPAEEWIAAGFNADPDDDEWYVGPWFVHRFSIPQAEAWREAGIEDGNQAAELRARRVTPQMIAELEDAEGYDSSAPGYDTDVRHQADRKRSSTLGWRDMSADDIVDVLDARGIRRNPKRTSRPRR